MNVYKRTLALGLGLALMLWLRPAAAQTTTYQSKDGLAENKEQERADVERTDFEKPAKRFVADKARHDDCDDDSHADCATEGECGREWGWTAGVEATYLKPKVHDCPCLEEEADLFAQQFVNFDGFEAAPRVWLGVEGCAGRGLRARYWQYDADDAFNNVDLNNVAITTASANLEMYTIDLEATRRVQWREWDLLGSVGARHAAISRHELLSFVDIPNDVAAGSFSSMHFSGIGITAGLEGRRPFGDRGLALFVNARGSAMVGTININSQGTLDGTLVEGNSEQQDKTLWILESQAGLEWSADLTCCKGTVFARAALEYQYWRTDDLHFDYTLDNGGPILGVTSLSPDVDLYGVAISMGLTR